MIKPINNSAEKKYDSFEEWAEDMLKGLKHDLKCYKKQCRGKLDLLNLNEYLEGLYVSQFLEWFIRNHFEEVKSRINFKNVHNHHGKIKFMKIGSK